MSDFPPQRILRNLPGVAEIEALLVKAKAHPSFKWSDYWLDAEKLASQVGKRLFGLSAEDTKWKPPDAEDGWDCEGAWEDEFLDYDEVSYGRGGRPKDYALADLGWDISDGSGGDLMAAELLYRQLVLVHFDIAGHEYGAKPSEEELQADAEAAAGKLEADVEAWRRKRR